MGFLQIEAEENVEADEGADAETERGNTGITAQFAVDIINRQDETDDRLGFAELGRIGIDAKIAARALADLAMQLKLNSDLVPNPGNFPSVVADFVLDWSIGTVDDTSTQGVDEFSGVSLSELGDGFLKSGSLEIAFDDIGLDLGKYFSDVIGPIVDKVQEATAPIKPFLDFLTEPIPVISDLAGPTSLLDIAAMSGVVNPGLIKAIEVVDQVIDIVNDIQEPAAARCCTWMPCCPEVRHLPDAAVRFRRGRGHGDTELRPVQAVQPGQPEDLHRRAPRRA